MNHAPNSQSTSAHRRFLWGIFFFLCTSVLLWLAQSLHTYGWGIYLAIALLLTLLFLTILGLFARKYRASPSPQESPPPNDESFRVLFNTVEQGVLIYDRDENILNANPAAGKIFGVPSELLIGGNNDNSEWDVIREDGSQYTRSQYPVSISIRTGQPVHKVVLGIRGPATNHYLWLLIDVYPRFNRLKEITGAYCIFTDVTHLKQVEQSLRNERSLLEDILESAMAGYWDVDEAKGIGYYSPSYKQMFGYTAHELDNAVDTWQALIHPEDHLRLDQIIRCPHPTPGKQFSLECRWRHKQGHWVWVICAGKIMERDKDGIPTRAIGCLIDISARKQADEERNQLHEHLINMQKLESLGKLAGGVAHDSNNLLQLIMGHAEIALEKVTQEDPALIHLKAIQEASQRSAKLVRQLLAFARKQTILPVRLNLNRLIQDSLPILKEMVGNHVELCWTPGNPLGEILADPTQIDQILSNLCTNAKEAIHHRGRIKISTHDAFLNESPLPQVKSFVPGRYVRLTVSDNGEGIPKEIVNRIFDPFFTTKPLGEGHGLGLSTIYGIVKQNGGLIQFEHAEQGGSIFHIYLPHASMGNRTPLAIPIDRWPAPISYEKADS